MPAVERPTMVRRFAVRQPAQAPRLPPTETAQHGYEWPEHGAIKALFKEARKIR